jgi:hypothetical protein
LLAVFFVAGDRFDGFARALLSAKKFLPFVTESPERRRPQIELRTSVGAIDQVDIKDTSFGPRKERQTGTISLQITHRFETYRRLEAKRRGEALHSFRTG